MPVVRLTDIRNAQPSSLSPARTWRAEYRTQSSIVGAHDEALVGRAKVAEGRDASLLVDSTEAKGGAAVVHSVSFNYGSDPCCWSSFTLLVSWCTHGLSAPLHLPPKKKIARPINLDLS